jgi:hypothetical protein
VLRGSSSDLIAMRLARVGYCNGNPLQILKMPASIVFKMLHYDNFVNEYEKEAYLLNTPEYENR